MTTEYYQRGFGLKGETRQIIQQDYYDDLIDQIRLNNYQLTSNNLTIKLAKEFGFCYGVERTVQYIYETIMRFPDRNIYITNEVIHNPYVNQRLMRLGLRFLSSSYKGEEGVDDIKPEDIVILPAFGVTVFDMKKLKQKGCVLIDTTCGSVLNVWKNVEAYARDGFTAIIHGKYSHEETLATVSQVSKYTGKYLVIKDAKEADIISDYILGKGNKADFVSRFFKAANSDFNPDVDLQKIGLANQTTMLSSESLHIENILRQAVIQKFGTQDLDLHFRAFDTICTATQDRQEAVLELLKDGVDLLLVIGGYNSSNTTHLAELARDKVRTYHIEDSGSLISKTEIKHHNCESEEVVTSTGWLPEGQAVIGITAGASTPNNIIADVIERLIEIKCK